jgi:hypothetical protein
LQLSLNPETRAESFGAPYPQVFAHKKSPHEAGHFYSLGRIGRERSGRGLFRQFVHRGLVELAVHGQTTITLEGADLSNRAAT